MDNGPRLSTPRLVLRRWRSDDAAPFAHLNADPIVMEHFPSVLSRAESDALLARIEAGFEVRGYGLWAVEIRDVTDFAGFVGLNPVDFEAHFTPAVEIGWRLDRPWWGQGYATEGAAAAVEFAFERLGLSEVVSFTAQRNLRSRAVMERLGMTHDPAEDFDHPRLAPDHALCRHVLYRLPAPGRR
jgi:RimJ/RimL family protein N-acetyltransferase